MWMGKRIFPIQHVAIKSAVTSLIFGIAGIEPIFGYCCRSPAFLYCMTMVAKLSSDKTISDTPLATSVPVIPCLLQCRQILKPGRRSHRRRSSRRFSQFFPGFDDSYFMLRRYPGIDRILGYCFFKICNNDLVNSLPVITSLSSRMIFNSGQWQWPCPR